MTQCSLYACDINKSYGSTVVKKIVCSSFFSPLTQPSSLFFLCSCIPVVGIVACTDLEQAIRSQRRMQRNVRDCGSSSDGKRFKHLISSNTRQLHTGALKERKRLQPAGTQEKLNTHTFCACYVQPTCHRAIWLIY